MRAYSKGISKQAKSQIILLPVRFLRKLLGDGAPTTQECESKKEDDRCQLLKNPTYRERKENLHNDGEGVSQANSHL